MGGALVAIPDAVLGILPRGTANSIAGHLGVPRDVDEACAVMLAGHSRVIDTATVNGRPMLLMATLGVHAEAVTEVDPARKQALGVLAYVLEGAERMLDDDLFEVTIEANGGSAPPSWSTPSPSPTSRARRRCSPRAPPAPRPTTASSASPWSPSAGSSRPWPPPSTWPPARCCGGPPSATTSATSCTREVRVETREPRRVMVDGEDAMDTPITVRCVPQSLRVLVPAEKG